MTLYFGTRETRKVIANPKSTEEASRIIHKFCEDRKFKVYYSRSWIDEDGSYIYDVGSWSHFFWLYTGKEDKDGRDHESN